MRRSYTTCMPTKRARGNVRRDQSERLRVAIYVRLSVETEQTTSPERQVATCRAEAERRGWDVVMVSDADVDVSATRHGLNRPGLDKIRESWDDIDVVMFTRVDRLARSLLDFATLMEEADEHGVALVSATEPIDLSTPMGRAMAQIIAIFAELEASAISERVTSTAGHLRRIGQAHGGVKVYGYKSIKNPEPKGRGKILVIDEERAAVVREAAERVLDGESVLTISRDFMRREIPAPRGGTRWSPSVVLRILRNPAITGLTMYRGSILRGGDGLPLAHWDPILEPPVFRRLQDVLDGRSTARGRRVNRNWLLSGIVACDECGNALHGHRANDRGGTPREMYRCGTRQNGGECSGVSIARASLDGFVTDKFLSTFGRLEVVRVVNPDPDTHAEDIARVRAALDDLEADRYVRGLFRGDSGAARYADLHSALEDKLAALDALPVVESTPQLVSTGETFAEAWESGDDVNYRRRLLADAIEVLTVAKAQMRGRLDLSRVTLEWMTKDDGMTV